MFHRAKNSRQNMTIGAVEQLPACCNLGRFACSLLGKPGKLSNRIGQCFGPPSDLMQSVLRSSLIG